MKVYISFLEGTKSGLPEAIEVDPAHVHLTIKNEEGGIVAAGGLQAFVDLSGLALRSLTQPMVKTVPGQEVQ